MATDYHAKLYAEELLKRGPSDHVESLTAILMDSQVDLNPHQVDAALFAFRSPLSKGVILADEVGLGKTIEAGIVLSQKWAERKRKILIILPSNLRKQWQQELWDKFGLPTQILETKNFNKSMKCGHKNPFENDEIVICSYQFAKNKSDFVRRVHWDLVVIDEAHRLRNVYKPSNVIARELKSALEGCPKLLLTATPLQNSLLELYGLVSFIDEMVFGDKKSFQEQFVRLSPGSNFDDLKHRLQPICKRTLRRQVTEYIRFTERIAQTQEFIPTKEEKQLYEMVSTYLQRPNLYALPPSQRSLMTLVLRKLLASSTFAIAGALDSLIKKLEKQLDCSSKRKKDSDEEFIEEIGNDFETLGELEEEIESDLDDEPALNDYDREAILEEIQELKVFYDRAVLITNNAKGKSLLQALSIGFEKINELGGAQKAIIFTESKRTQNYLVQLLSENGYIDDIVLFNGDNNDPKSTQIYNNWKKQNEGSDKITGLRSADIRAALVDHFREDAKIMIATEAASEGINLQFCSLVVNYDLPWNPQRIEQRIGRCHRYGQKYDVVVVNFINKENAADQRVYQLLSEKFRLFNGVFGASDEVLGAIESGVDFEKRIAEIYQQCRTSDEIQTSFDQLQQELSVEIDENMQTTRQKLLENFDNEVTEKLKVYNKQTNLCLNKYEVLLWELTKYMLYGMADFNDSQMSFTLHESIQDDSGKEIPTGLYFLKRGNQSGHCYRINNPLAQWILDEVEKIDLPKAAIVFDYTNSGKNIAILDPVIGKSGTLIASKMAIESLDKEEHIILAGICDDETKLDADQARRLFNLPGIVKQNTNTETEIDESVIANVYEIQKQEILTQIDARNEKYFDEEMDKLTRWADDKRKSLKGTMKDIESEKTKLNAEIRSGVSFQEKVQIQKQLRALEKKYDDAWREYDEDARKIDKQKESFLDEVEAKLVQEIREEKLFVIRWEVV
ncbi:SNF2-related protein [Methanolapillus millepedarum]|uniref:RNA polymerase-associated protein RapA n=1 Tax=Methanolapillus millepedarum TaxID=3028296 RepID=A0AA96ZUC2_9EURY|nr:RNA polymerase-associated protein RapA [Methanosarcinaceae archaeon Ac7]